MTPQKIVMVMRTASAAAVGVAASAAETTRAVDEVARAASAIAEVRFERTAQIPV